MVACRTFVARHDQFLRDTFTPSTVFQAELNVCDHQYDDRVVAEESSKQGNLEDGQ